MLSKAAMCMSSHLIISSRAVSLVLVYIYYRNDLELQFLCYLHNDKQEVCNWPNGLSVNMIYIAYEVGRYLYAYKFDSGISHSFLSFEFEPGHCLEGHLCICLRVA